MDDDRKRELLEKLVCALCAERGRQAPTVDSTEELWTAFRALVNTRPPESADTQLLAWQDELLSGIVCEQGIRSLADAFPCPSDEHLFLWRGDITTLAVDAVVNAANSQLLGCWVPGHHCIDNAIHTFAGIQLRLECDAIMQKQGHGEPTGSAKITDAYNLPARHVIHTVGPIANGRPSLQDSIDLASCYESCLDLAAANGLGSIAFCCISTGVFGFPQQQAAELAVNTVRAWLASRDSALDVVFNVFSESDERIYRQLLGIR